MPSRQILCAATAAAAAADIVGDVAQQQQPLSLADVVLVCLSLVSFVSIAWFALSSCWKLGSHFRSADNIFERTRGEKRVDLGPGHAYSFVQQYREDGMGVGSALWDGSIVLAEHLIDSAPAACKAAGGGGAALDLAGKRVLELGTGVGLVSIVAARLGASEVVATDGDAALLPLTRRNVARNLGGSGSGENGEACGAGGMPAQELAERRAAAKVLRVEELLWGDEAQQAAVGAGGLFDVILAADVVYESSINKGAMLQAYEGLFESMWQLSHDDTLVLLAYKQRFATEPLFFSVMTEYFEQEQLQTDKLAAHAEHSGLQIFRYRKRKDRHGEAAGAAVKRD